MSESEQGLLNIVSSTNFVQSLVLIENSERNSIYYFTGPERKIVLKGLESGFSNDKQKQKNEYEISKKILHPAFRKVYLRILHQIKEAIVLEWADGHLISKFNKLNVQEFLSVGREIVSALVALHTRSIMHSNLT